MATLPVGLVNCFPVPEKCCSEFLFSLSMNLFLQGVLLPAQPVSAELPRAARRDDPTAHLHGVPKQLPVDPRPDGRRILVLMHARESLLRHTFILLLFMAPPVGSIKYNMFEC